MRRVFVVLVLMWAVMAAGGAQRCRVETVRGARYLVCPCPGVTYQCEDWWGPIRSRR